MESNQPRSRKKSVFLAIGLVAAILLGRVLYDLDALRTAHFRQFDADR